MGGLSPWMCMAVCWPYLSALALWVPSRGGEHTRAAILSVVGLGLAIGWWWARAMSVHDALLLCPPLLLCLATMVHVGGTGTWARVDAVMAQCVAGNAMAAIAADDVDVTIALLALTVLVRVAPMVLRHGQAREGWRFFHAGTAGVIVAQAGALVLSPLGNGPLDGLGMVLLVAGLLGACGLVGMSLPVGRDHGLCIMPVVPVLYLLSGPVVSLDAELAAMTLRAMMIGMGCVMVWVAALLVWHAGMQGQREPGRQEPSHDARRWGHVMAAWIGLAVMGAGAGGAVGTMACVLAMMAVCLCAPLRARWVPWPALLRHVRSGLPPTLPFVAMMMTVMAVARVSVWAMAALLPALWLLLVGCRAAGRGDGTGARLRPAQTPSGMLARNAGALALLALLAGGLVVVAYPGGL
ncbi:hypothetical protein [Novacetimonas maltaceti]|uniref:Uncharacterized protein n=1 Tax=Novacetimonas maltaceti TaxID=1203393 RepID=A0A2S3VYP7_9PROT|nr:hypothetical protein [Novacetimonas maltaceti]POF61423.1 hypothetical protein KMAL_29480 [Novacetimonas maltaceti]